MDAHGIAGGVMPSCLRVIQACDHQGPENKKNRLRCCCASTRQHPLESALPRKERSVLWMLRKRNGCIQAKELSAFYRLTIGTAIGLQVQGMPPDATVLLDEILGGLCKKKCSGLTIARQGLSGSSQIAWWQAHGK